MEFRDLKAQYTKDKEEINAAIQNVLDKGCFIGGEPVERLEKKLAEYVGVKHCISCANGTDALQLALMSWGIGKGDAVFVPDFTFFSTAEIIPWVGAAPVFVDVETNTFNLSAVSLEKAIQRILHEGKLIPKVVIAVNLFGQPADYPEIKKITDKYGLLLLEDGAQGFGGRIGDRKACSFGDIATTSFFPAKPLGCYGDGGAVFTNHDEWAELLKSYKVHGKGSHKYDNIRIGLNSRLDTMQAAILLAKFDRFAEEELFLVDAAAEYYSERLKGIVNIPTLKEGVVSSWAQYTIRLNDKKCRKGLQNFLKENEIPSMVYYEKPLHRQEAFYTENQSDEDLQNTIQLCETVLSLPMHPYITKSEIEKVTACIWEYYYVNN